MTSTETPRRPPSDALLALATEVVAEVLDLAPAQVRATANLFDLPGFDSLAVVAILDRIEERLATEVPAAEVVPEAFESVRSIAELIHRSLPEPEDGRSAR